MQISARLENAHHAHRVSVTTDGRQQSLTIPCKPGGLGSSVNGGALLFLALAVEVTGEFGGRGEPASQVSYRATVSTDAKPEELKQLLEEIDRVAEIQNTLRQAAQFGSWADSRAPDARAACRLTRPWTMTSAYAAEEVVD